MSTLKLNTQVHHLDVYSEVFFDVLVSLPNEMTAKFEEGVLKLKIPKKQHSEVEKEKIQIKIE